MAKRGFLSLEISIDYPNLQSKYTFLCSPLLFYMVVCPSLSPFTMMKITAYGGRHLSHIQPFLSLSRVLYRARTFLLFNSLSLSNGKTTCRTASNLQAEKLSFRGVWLASAENGFPLRGEWRASAERGH